MDDAKRKEAKVAVNRRIDPFSSFFDYDLATLK
jgi:hypothetical protein